MNKLLLLTSFCWLVVANLSAQVISEIQYKTPGIPNADDEWIEICNPTSTDINISDFQLLVDNTLQFTFPANTILLGDACITVALRDDGDDTNSFNDGCPFTPDYVIAGVTINGSTTSSNVLINSNNHTIIIKNTTGTTIDNVTYNGGDIPASEEGKTLTLVDLNEDNSSTVNGFPWVFSNDFGGSPSVSGNVLCATSSTIVEFRTLFAAIEESVGTISTVVCVTLQRPSMTEDTTVELKLDSGTATNGVDTESFADLTTLTFPAGSLTEQCLEITILDDEDNEGNESFNFSLQNPMGGRNMAELGDNQTLELVILEDDYATAVINEVLFDPPGADGDREYIEIKGQEGANLSGITLLYLDGDAGSIGRIQQTVNLGALNNGAVTLGINGFALICDEDRVQTFSPAPDTDTNLATTNLSLQNGTATFLLVTNYQNSNNDSDLDDEDDGVLDAILWDTVLDAVSISDGGADDVVYAATLGGVDIPDNTVGKAEAIFRDFDESWYAATIEGGTGDYQFDLENVWDSNNQIVDLTQFSPTFLTPGGDAQPSPPLKIQLVDFRATTRKKQILLQWQTTQEKDNAYFIVARSRDGSTFDEIGRVKGFSTTNNSQRYQFKDMTPSIGANYYQLGWVDFSGKTEWSEVIRIDNSIDNNLVVYPTIVQDRLQIKGVIEATVINLFNASGQLALQEKLSPIGINTASLPCGIYFLIINQQQFKICKI